MKGEDIMAKETQFCEKCRKTMDFTNFYTSKNIEKYPPDGRMNQCKKCLTMHVNSWEPTTFINILKEVDVPYIETEWNGLLDKYGKDPRKVTGVTILGRYLSKMKLKQFSHLVWSDTEQLAADAERKRGLMDAQTLAQQNRYAAALNWEDIEKLEKNPDQLSEEELEKMTDEELGLVFAQPNQKPVEEDDWAPFKLENQPKVERPEDKLTPEDKMYLTLKWGKLYRAEEWIALEQFWYEMDKSFDIQGAAHKDYLKMICKTSLKMNQAIDCGDIEGFAKLQKAYDSLMKSAKFTAAQNKAESGEFVDSVSELVYLSEEQGFIERYHIDEPKDIVDVTLRDMKSYSYRLVTEEMGLGNMIEAALQQMLREQDKEEGELDENDEFLDPDASGVLQDVDHEDYYNEIEAQSQKDQELIKEETSSGA